MANIFCPQCGLALPKNARFCLQCGSPIPTVAPVAEPSLQQPDDHVPRSGWYPNKGQWWAIWITAGIVGLGLLSTGESVGLLAVAMWGGLLIWQLSRRRPSGHDAGKRPATAGIPTGNEPLGSHPSRQWVGWAGLGIAVIVVAIMGSVANSNSVHQTYTTYRPETNAQPVGQISPQNVRESEGQPTVRKPSAAHRESPRDYFTIGSSVGEVLRVQGTPTAVNDFGISKTYSWGLSTVTFMDGKVSEFSNLGGNLHVRVTEPAERKPRTAQRQLSEERWQQQFPGLSELVCEPFRAKYEQLSVGDHWTKISQIFGPYTSAQDTGNGGTTYIYDLSDCRLTFRTGQDGKLTGKQMNLHK
jgi:hypothetical protein